MLGWCSEAINCASRSKRAIKWGSSFRFACSNLMATCRWSCVSSAFQTSAMPPCPSCCWSSYLPRRRGFVLITLFPHLCAAILAIINCTGCDLEGGQSLNVVVNLHHTFLHRIRVRVELSNEGIVGLGEQVIEDGRCTRQLSVVHFLKRAGISMD